MGGVLRDRRLDFWRGLCLVDMVLVHLVHEGIQFGPLAPLIIDYTRFAAGGFVFVAGVSVGIVAGVGSGRPLRPATMFWKRALYLLGVHYALTALVIVAETARGWRAPIAAPVELLRDIVLWRVAPPYIDVLPLYVVMLGVTPLLLGMLQRGLWPLLVAASGVAFVHGRHAPTAWSPLASAQFPVLLWQAFFVAGLLFSVIVPHLDAQPRRWRVAFAIAWPAFALLTVLAHGPAAAAFAKVPLTGAELARYLAVTLAMVTAAAVFWQRIRSWASVGVVAALGRRSLAVYGGHVFAQMATVALATPLWWLGAAQALAVVPMLGSLFLLARALDAWDAVERPALALRRILRAWGAPPAGAAIAAVLLFGLASGPTRDLDAVPGEAAVDRIADADLGEPALDLIDVRAGQDADPGAPAGDPASSAEELPAPETMEDEAPIQSGFGAPRYA